MIAEENPATQPFLLNSRVIHRTWGEGLVMRYEGDKKIVILSDRIGYKTLDIDMVRQRGLLESAQEVDVSPNIENLCNWIEFQPRSPR